MKRKFEHPEPGPDHVTGPKYWRSLDELSETPEFKEWLHREFPAGASELEGVNRRQFVKIMAASFGLAGLGLAGCRQPESKILPYGKQPERVVPGVPMYYATSRPGPHEHIPLVVETHQARPTKVEGNPSYRPFAGTTDAFTQASILDLYDPDRAAGSADRTGAALNRAAVADLLATLGRTFEGERGRGLAILVEPSSSPSRARLLQALRRRFPELLYAEYTPVDLAGPERALAKLGNGRLRPIYHFGKAKRILSLDADFLSAEAGALAYARGYADSRRILNAKEADQMSRLYVAESTFSVTGSNADHRLRIAASRLPALACFFAAEILAGTGGDSTLISHLRDRARAAGGNPKWVVECARDLLANRGASVVVAGSHLPEEVQILVHAMNVALGGQGQTVSYVRVTDEPEPASLRDLVDAANRGTVRTLVVLGGNPVYDAPADLAFAEVLKKLPQVIRHGYYGFRADETSAAAHVFLAATHYLESWGDGRTFDGVYVPVQPMILPLFDGQSELEVLARLAGETNPDPYAIVRETFQAQAKGSGADFETWLAEGVWPNTEYPEARLAAPALLAVLSQQPVAPEVPAVSAQALEVRLVPSLHTWDGRFANNGWMQEVPDPMTRLSWDNAILVSPKLGRELGIIPEPGFLVEKQQLHAPMAQSEKNHELAKVGELSVNGRTVRGPLSVMPGLPDYTVVIALGYGRATVGRVGEGAGFSAYPLRTSASTAFATGAKLRLTGGTFALANTQMHWSMEGRDIVREANVDDYQKHPDFAKKMGVESHSPPIYGAQQGLSMEQKALTIPRGNSAFKTPDFGAPAPNVAVWNQPGAAEQWVPPQQWGMSIDLNTCIGCNACVVACQSENNVPIVGKDQVLRGREMHWLRIDRYFSSASEDTRDIPEDPQVVFQAMLCQHCEIAPCEYVCPVNATVHDEMGINTMAYNRCVGTRYCANNCPYKVRRFNFFDWNKRQPGHFYEGPLGPDNYKLPSGELPKMQRNPDVTVRMRGVMEKCTFCVQRVEEGRINQRVKAKDSGNVHVPDGTIKTACQQSCPAGAIVFGDITDTTSEVYRIKQSDRDYSVLGYLNTRPRVTYLARLRNPNPAMPDYTAQPLSRAEYDRKAGHGAAHGTQGQPTPEGGHGPAHAPNGTKH